MPRFIFRGSIRVFCSSWLVCWCQACHSRRGWRRLSSVMSSLLVSRAAARSSWAMVSCRCSPVTSRASSALRMVSSRTASSSEASCELARCSTSLVLSLACSVRSRLISSRASSRSVCVPSPAGASRRGIAGDLRRASWTAARRVASPYRNWRETPAGGRPPGRSRGFRCRSFAGACPGRLGVCGRRLGCGLAAGRRCGGRPRCQCSSLRGAGLMAGLPRSTGWLRRAWRSRVVASSMVARSSSVSRAIWSCISAIISR